eukprot:scaffold32688_cov14-Prasinocladus_malaysianus.AAC.1
MIGHRSFIGRIDSIKLASFVCSSCRIRNMSGLERALAVSGGGVSHREGFGLMFDLEVEPVQLLQLHGQAIDGRVCRGSDPGVHVSQAPGQLGNLHGKLLLLHRHL